MSPTEKICEERLYEIWRNRQFVKELETNDGDKVEILDTGVHNTDEAGPDFVNARIQIGNLTYVGDIEIDGNYSDWKNHGHNIDSRYNKVVLHASFQNKFNQNYVYTKDGRKIPSVCISDFICLDDAKTIKDTLPAQNDDPAKNKFKCAYSVGEVDFEIRKNFVTHLGMDRFSKKTERIYNRLKEIKFIKANNLKEPVVRYEFDEDFKNTEFSNEDFFDANIWQQVLYEFILEALGYSKNKNIMMNLARSLDLVFLKSISNSEDVTTHLEAALFTVGGLLPPKDESGNQIVKNYIEMLHKYWNEIKNGYDCGIFDKEHWHFLKMRPQNFPTIRLAAAARIINKIINHDLISVMVKKINEIHSLQVLLNSLRSLFVIKSEGFWQNHYVFKPAEGSPIKYFVGVGRADEIMINVLLPYFSVYFDVFGKTELSKKVLKVYNIYDQNSENKIVSEVASILEMEKYSKKTLYNQGMLELFRNYCSKNRCEECEIGKVVFQ